MAQSRYTLAVGFGKRAATMLVELVNARPDPAAFERFKERWELPPQTDKPADRGFRWDGGYSDFTNTQDLMRRLWEEQRGLPQRLNVAMRLGLEPVGTAENGGVVVAVQPPIALDWANSRLELLPRSLNELAWLTLLQHSRRLGICANKEHGCPTPYFLKTKPKHRFCSEACAAPTQREFKRRWWAEHGDEWRHKRQKAKKKKKKKSPRKRRR
jgi:hypothetical protein